MKYLLSIFLLLTITFSVDAQNCYTAGRSNGIANYNQEKYKEALNSFAVALNNCPDVPTNNDLKSWIKKCKDKLNSPLISNAPMASAPLSGTVNAVLQEIASNMVYVSGGSFTMGCTSEQSDDYYGDEKPSHSVTVSSFYISKYEVTQKQWKSVVGSNPSSFKGDNLPVENVSWTSVQKFISKLNELTGKKYRLPTEAEWEFASRGGTKSLGYKYSGGNDIDAVAWYHGNSNSHSHSVGLKRSNELGLYDMSGNVLEWCSDWYAGYSSFSQTNPQGPSTGSFCVFRGGCWIDYARSCRVSSRGFNDPGYNYYSLGFRLCL